MIRFYVIDRISQRSFSVDDCAFISVDIEDITSSTISIVHAAIIVGVGVKRVQILITGA